MDTVDIEVKLKLLDKVQDKLMDLYLDALVRISNLEKYVQSININFAPNQEKDSDVTDYPLEEEEQVKPTTMYKRVYNEETPEKAVTPEDKKSVLWDMAKGN